ncbi:hypothetical protein NP570_23825, partial [Vibrio parahaemolyticus]|nr:hypothetical protein [Vibrio parahaemolyticus]
PFAQLPDLHQLLLQLTDRIPIEICEDDNSAEALRNNLYFLFFIYSSFHLLWFLFLLLYLRTIPEQIFRHSMGFVA